MSFPDLPKPDRRIGRMAIVEKLKLSFVFFSIYRRGEFQNIAGFLVNDLLIIC